MILVDMNDDTIYTPASLFRAWCEFKKEDPANHAKTFRAEYLEILLATINGRNDLEIMDMPPREVSDIIIKLMKLEGIIKKEEPGK